MSEWKEIIDHLQVLYIWADVGAKSVTRKGIEQNCCGSAARWVWDALKLLQDVRPRILTADEIKNLPKRAVVWEEYKSGGRVWRDVRPLIKSCYGAKLIDEDGEVDIDEELLNTKNGDQRRLWSGKPSKEQRRAAKWE